MTKPYRLGPSFGQSPACLCQVFKDNDLCPELIVLGETQQDAESKAQRLIDRLNDKGLPFWLQLVEPKPEAQIIPIRRVRR
jgi:hypothetical protein